MGAMSNEPRRLAYLTGFYKGLQSAGSAITFRIDALKTPFMVSLHAWQNSRFAYVADASAGT